MHLANQHMTINTVQCMVVVCRCNALNAMLILLSDEDFLSMLFISHVENRGCNWRLL
jgi:hypothetical protein